MKNRMALLLVLALLMTGFAVPVLAETERALVLPEGLKAIGTEAFMGEKAITSVVIPKNVERVEARAFSGCTGLKSVYFGKKQSVTIADDAFEGCGDVHCYAFPGTAGELYALSHGYECDLLEEGSAFLDQALAMVSRYGGTGSVLQGSEFATKRLIVRMSGERLPDISAYHPVEILREGDGIFFLQFGEVDETVECYGCLKNLEKGGSVIFVEPDARIEAIDDLESAGVADGDVWDTDDPMGFDTYAPYVAQNSSGKVTVAIIDSGVKKLAAYKNILRADGVNLASDGADWSDDRMAHGSVIAGIIKDCVGSANVELLPIRVVSGNNTADLSMIALAIQYAINHGADIINLSLNFEENAYVSYWLEKAMVAGVKVIVAAGNGGMDIAKVFPANVPGVIAVSGIDSKYSLTKDSNFGANISYCAPAAYVTTTAYPGVTRKGTSFAAPMVASAFALARLDGNHSESDLQSCCRQLTKLRPDYNNYGFGLMQLGSLVYTPLEGIDITSVPQSLNVGDTGTLKWAFRPANATDKAVTVTSGNTSVIRIASTGTDSAVLSAVGNGTATVTVRSTSGIAATANVTVGKSYTLIMDANEGYIPENGQQVEQTSKTAYSGAPVGQLPTPVREGYIFEGWYTKASGGSLVTEDTAITCNSVGYVIYAHWKKLNVLTLNYSDVTLNATTCDRISLFVLGEGAVIHPGVGESVQAGINVDFKHDNTPPLQLRAYLNGTAIPAADVTWTAAKNYGYGVVDENGLVTGESNSGFTTMSPNASSDDTVITATLKSDETAKASVHITFVYDAQITFWTDDTSVATVDSQGLVTGVKEGQTKLHMKSGLTGKEVERWVVVGDPQTIYGEFFTEVTVEGIYGMVKKKLDVPRGSYTSVSDYSSFFIGMPRFPYKIEGAQMTVEILDRADVLLDTRSTGSIEYGSNGYVYFPVNLSGISGKFSLYYELRLMDGTIVHGLWDGDCFSLSQ